MTAATPVLATARPDCHPLQPGFLRRLFRQRFPAFKTLYEERYSSFYGSSASRSSHTLPPPVRLDLAQGSALLPPARPQPVCRHRLAHLRPSARRRLLQRSYEASGCIVPRQRPDESEVRPNAPEVAPLRIQWTITCAFPATITKRVLPSLSISPVPQVCPCCS